MSETLQMERPKIGLHVIKNEKDQRQRQREKSIELRLGDLGTVVADLVDVAHPLFGVETTSIRETWEELAVKEATLRWIVRVAKHSEGRIRERLLLDVEKALDGLERTVDSVAHAGCT
jgi:hypothetical protein